MSTFRTMKLFGRQTGLEELRVASRMVIEMLRAQPGMSTQELFRQSEIKYPEKPFPIAPEPMIRYGKRGVPKENPPPLSRPGHAICSMRYLKSVVLDDLARRRIIKKVHQQREPVTELEKATLAKKNVGYQHRHERRTVEGRVDPVTQFAFQKETVDYWTWYLAEDVPGLTEGKVSKAEQEDGEVTQASESKKPSPIKSEDPKPKTDPYGASEWDHLNSRRRKKRESGPTREDQVEEFMTKREQYKTAGRALGSTFQWKPAGHERGRTNKREALST